jgi:hypothetical protein
MTKKPPDNEFTAAELTWLREKRSEDRNFRRKTRISRDRTRRLALLRLHNSRSPVADDQPTSAAPRQATPAPPPVGDLTVVESGGDFYVAVAGPFSNHASAWAWVDQNSDEGRADTDRFRRIRTAFSKR